MEDKRIKRLPSRRIMKALKEGFVVLLAGCDRRDVFGIRFALKRLSSSARVFAVRHGDEAVDYLQGDGKYADRVAWPLPRILALDEWTSRLTGRELLQWVRSDERFRLLPVVVLGRTGQPMEPTLLGKLKAAYCAKTFESDDMAGVFEASICAALRLVWENPLMSHATCFLPQAPTPLGLKNRLDSSQEEV